MAYTYLDITNEILARFNGALNRCALLTLVVFRRSVENAVNDASIIFSA